MPTTAPGQLPDRYDGRPIADVHLPTATIVSATLDRFDVLTATLDDGTRISIRATREQAATLRAGATDRVTIPCQPRAAADIIGARSIKAPRSLVPVHPATLRRCAAAVTYDRTNALRPDPATCPHRRLMGAGRLPDGTTRLGCARCGHIVGTYATADLDATPLGAEARDRDEHR